LQQRHPEATFVFASERKLNVGFHAPFSALARDSPERPE
jgi:hypothetical protein